MKFFLTILLLSSLFWSCKPKSRPLVQNIVARAGTEELKLSDISGVLLSASESEDSSQFVKEYIKNWAINELIYQDAVKYYQNDLEIEKLVESYRRTLIVHKYSNYLFSEGNAQATDLEIEEFYNNHKSDFLLKEPLMKGGFLSVVKNNKNISMLHRAMKKLDEKSIDQIEKYSINNIVNYNFFVNDWHTLSSVNYLIPKAISDNSSKFGADKFFEVQDSIFHYFLSIKEFVPEGGVSPIETVKTKIATILNEKKNREFFENYKETLFDKSLKKGVVQIK